MNVTYNNSFPNQKIPLDWNAATVIILQLQMTHYSWFTGTCIHKICIMRLEGTFNDFEILNSFKTYS
jgi:hypothetical protein